MTPIAQLHPRGPGRPAAYVADVARHRLGPFLAASALTAAITARLWDDFGVLPLVTPAAVAAVAWGLARRVA